MPSNIVSQTVDPFQSCPSLSAFLFPPAAICGENNSLSAFFGRGKEMFLSWCLGPYYILHKSDPNAVLFFCSPCIPMSDKVPNLGFGPKSCRGTSHGPCLIQKHALGTGFGACNCLFGSRNCVLTSRILGHCYKLDWPKRGNAVYWFRGTLFYSCSLGQRVPQWVPFRVSGSPGPLGDRFLCNWVTFLCFWVPFCFYLAPKASVASWGLSIFVQWF